jgi:hypothetical protein
VFDAACVFDNSAVLPICLRCWNFSRIEESFDWY